MRMAIAAVLAVAFLGVQAFGQTGVKQRVGDRLGGAVNEHNQELERAMNGEDKKPTTPAAEKNDGWIERAAPDGTKVRMYFAHPAVGENKKANLPALVVIQEWWGLNEDIQERTRELASKGFYALAVDLYDGKSTKDPKEAAELRKKLTDPGAMSRLKVGVGVLTEEARNGTVDPNRLGVIGWCMGGEMALKLAVSDPRVKAVVMFYGTPVTDPAKLKNLKGPLLGIFGAEDKSIPVDTVKKLDKALEEAKVPHEIKIYPGAGHAFASKAAAGMGLYKEPQAKEAWTVTWDWLEKNLKNAPAK